MSNLGVISTFVASTFIKPSEPEGKSELEAVRQEPAEIRRQLEQLDVGAMARGGDDRDGVGVHVLVWYVADGRWPPERGGRVLPDVPY